MSLVIDGVEFETIDELVIWLSKNKPDIKTPEELIQEIQRIQSEAGLVTQDQVLKPDPGGLQPIKGKFKKDGGIFASAAVEPFSRDGKNFLRVFLLNTETNKNFWHVTPESIPLFAETFKGKPFIDDGGDNPEKDGKKRHFGAERLSLDEILTKQESFRVGNIIDIEIRYGNNEPELFAIVEITNQEIFDEINAGQDIYVSPAITGRPIRQPCGSLLYDQWHGLHLARVTDPAYGVMRASIKQTCEGSERQCIKSLISSAAALNISFNPLNDSEIMTSTVSSAAITTASEDEMKKLKEENASLTQKAAAQAETIDKLENKEKQNSQIASELQSKVATMEAKLAAEEEEDKKELASKIAQFEKEDEVEQAATEEELMKLDKEELARKAASASAYHTKLASMKGNGIASSPAKVVRMASTSSTASLKKDREEGKKLSLRKVMEAMQ